MQVEIERLGLNLPTIRSELLGHATGVILSPISGAHPPPGLFIIVNEHGVNPLHLFLRATMVNRDTLRRHVGRLEIYRRDLWNLLWSSDHVFIVEWNAWGLIWQRVVVLLSHLLYDFTLVYRVRIAWVLSVLDLVYVYHTYVQLPWTVARHFFFLRPLSLFGIQSLQFFEFVLAFWDNHLSLLKNTEFFPICSNLRVHNHVWSVPFHNWGSKETCFWLNKTSFPCLEMLLITFVRAFILFSLIFFCYIFINLILIKNRLQVVFIIGIWVLILYIVFRLGLYFFDYFWVVFRLHDITSKHIDSLGLHHLGLVIEVVLSGLALDLNYYDFFGWLWTYLFWLLSKYYSFLSLSNIAWLRMPILNIFLPLSILSSGSFIPEWHW